MSKKKNLREETCDSEEEELELSYEEPKPEIKKLLERYKHPYPLARKFTELPKDQVDNLVNWSKMTQSDSTSYRVKAAAIFCSV